MRLASGIRTAINARKQNDVSISVLSPVWRSRTLPYVGNRLRRSMVLVERTGPAQPMKIHLHSEQFDGYLHAACCRCPFDPPGPDPRIVGEKDFHRLPRERQCYYCRRES